MYESENKRRREQWGGCLYNLVFIMLAMVMAYIIAGTALTIFYFMFVI